MPPTSTPPSAVPALEIALLGGLVVRVGGQAIVLSARKAQAALAYLAARRGRTHAREHLQALLWPDAGKEQAQASLRQLLATLRAALPKELSGTLEAPGQALMLAEHSAQVDVHTLEALLREGTRAALEQAVALYRGPLLEGFVLGESGFDDWLAGERARLHEAMLAGLDQLAAMQAAAGELDAAVQSAQQALRLEPLRESAQRALMRLYLRQGNRAQALQQYELSADLLRAELGVEPELETQRLRQQLLQPMAIELSADRSPRPLEPAQGTLIGRHAALAELERWLAAEPGARVAVLQGEAGIGKTRLLTALSEHARSRGRAWLGARCFESEHGLPFALWAELLRTASQRGAPAIWRDLNALQRRELSRLLPASAAHDEQPTRLDDTRVLFEAVLEVVDGLTHAGPLLIVLEDVHWADVSSLQLLSFVARRSRTGHSLRIAVSLRSDALAGASGLRGLLRELKRERQLSAFELGPLAHADALQLLRAALGEHEAGVAAPWFERVWTISEGNPLAITECARSLQRRDLRHAARALAIPERVRDLIAERLTQLEPQALRVLELGSVIGRRFGFTLLAASLELAELGALTEPRAPTRALARTLIALVDRGLLVNDGDGFYFTHERIREVLYERLLEPERRAAHAAVASALEVLHADRLDELTGFLAQHFAHAGETERSARYLLRFARRCAQGYGFEQALRALDEAESAVGSLPSATADALRVELAVQRAGCLAQLRKMPEMEQCLLPLAPLVERLSDPRLAGPFHAWLALSQIFLGQPRDAEPRATLALAAAEGCADRETAGYAHSILCFAAMRRAQFRRGVEHGLRAVELLDCDEQGSAQFDPHISAFAWLHLGGNQLLLGDCAAARAAAQRAEAIAERCQSARLYSFALALRGNARAAQGELAPGLADCSEAVARAPDPYSGFFARLVLVRVAAFAALRAGFERALTGATYDEALRALEAAMGLGPALGLGAFQGVGRVALAETYLARGEAERARAAAQAALSLLSDEDDPFARACALRILGQSELSLREVGTGQARLREACQRFAALEAALELRLTQQLLPEPAPSLLA